MSFFKYQNRLFLAKSISFREVVRTSPCEYCRSAGKNCIEMKNQKKCAECTRLRKQIKLNKSHTAQKMQCVAAKLGSDNDDFGNKTVDESPSLFQIVDNLLNDLW